MTELGRYRKQLLFFDFDRSAEEYFITVAMIVIINDHNNKRSIAKTRNWVHLILHLQRKKQL